MATGVLLGDENGIAQRMTNHYIGDENGIAQKVVKAYIGDENGIAQLCYSGALNSVTITGLTEQTCVVVDGVTYNSGDVVLEVEIGKPIEICIAEIQGSTAQIVLNDSDALNSCRQFRYAVTGDVSIAFSTHIGNLYTDYKAVITEAEPTSGYFYKQTKYIVDGEYVYNYCGYSFRNGMKWDAFVASMYNDRSFLLWGDNVCYKATGNALLKPSSDDADSGYPVKATDSIINTQRYL
jgi:hypothetical protein